jgi:hypothetical protein
MHQLTLFHGVASLLLTAVSLITGVLGAPIVVPRQTITVLSAAQIAVFKPYTYFASTGYCSAASTLAWNCGGTVHILDALKGRNLLIEFRSQLQCKFGI